MELLKTWCHVIPGSQTELEKSYQVVQQVSQNRVTIVELTDDKAVDELFKDCLANTIADLPKTSQLVEARSNYLLVG